MATNTNEKQLESIIVNSLRDSQVTLRDNLPVYHCCTTKVNYVNNYYYAHVVRWMGLNGYIQSLYRGIRERSYNLGFDVFGRQFLPISPIDEQQAIVDFISQKTSQIDTLISSLSQQITSLKESKQRLISDVVTGKINVQTYRQ